MKWRCGGVCRSLARVYPPAWCSARSIGSVHAIAQGARLFLLGYSGTHNGFLDIFEGKFRPHVLGGERRDLRSARAFALLTSRRFELTHPLIFKLRAEIVLHRFVLNLCSDSDFIKRLYPRPL